MNPFQQNRLLTSERLQLFTRMAETLAEEAEHELSRWLSDCSVSVGQLEQIVITDLATPDTDLAVIKSNYSTGFGLIATDLQVALSIVAMLCGGVGQAPPEARPLSRLEMGVIDLVLQPVLNLATRLFSVEALELTTHVSGASGLPDGQPEPAIAIPLHLVAGNVEGQLTIALTASQLQTHLEELDRRIAGRMAVKRDAPAAEVVRALRPVPIELTVGFEILRVPAGRLADLQVGDVLRTRQLMSRSLVARVGNDRFFDVRVAQRGQRLVAEITGRANNEKGVE